MKSTIHIWNERHSILMLMALLIAIGIGDIRVLPLLLSISIIYYIISNREEKHLWSYANIVTLFRLGIILFTTWNISDLEETTLLMLFGIALAMDGLDGYLARHYKQASDFGAYLDMETDSFFVAALSFHWWQNHVTSWWILIIGFMRYSYVLIFTIVKTKGKEKSTRFAKTIAVIFMLGMLSPWVLPLVYAWWVLIIISLLTAYSFGVSFVGRSGWGK